MEQWTYNSYFIHLPTAMEIIYQTNRTMLFEEINPEKLDLITIVGDVKGIDSLSDEKIKEINQHLLVRSFDEFLDKFSPTVYSFLTRPIKKSSTPLKSQKELMRIAFLKFV